MITMHSATDQNTLVLEATGTLTTTDYEGAFIPLVKGMLTEHGSINLVLHLDPYFQGWEAGALWEDAKFGLEQRHNFKRLALVGGPTWAQWMAKVGTSFMSGRFKIFDPEALEAAIAWAKLPEPPAPTPAEVAAAQTS